MQARSTQSTFSTTTLANNENVRVEVFNGPATDTICSDISESSIFKPYQRLFHINF